MISAATRWAGLVALGLVAGCDTAAVPAANERDALRIVPAAEPSTEKPWEKLPMPAAEPAAAPKARTLDEMLLFFPSKYPDGEWRPDGLTFRDAWFTAADGTRLHGWYCPCEGARAVVLYAHGNAGNLSHRASRMRYFQRELRVASLVFDYRGYGRSEGTPTVEGVLQDARAARKCLADLAGVRESRIVLLGDSLGGAVVADLAGRDGARGLVLESTFSSLKDVAAHHYPHLSWLVPTDKLNSAARLAAYAKPLLQCHGDADRTIPIASGRKLFEAAPGSKQFVRMAGGDHNDPPSAEYFRQLDRFINELPER